MARLPTLVTSVAPDSPAVCVQGTKAARPLTSLAGVRVSRKRSLAASKADARIGRAGGVLSV